jgi:hypothetical protein
VWPLVGLLAAAALVTGVVVALDWFGTESSGRSTAKIIVAGWDVVAGLWLGAEAVAIQRGDTEGIESIGLGAGLVAVLAGVGISRGWSEPLQALLIVACGLGGGAAQYALWRLQGAPGLPWGAGVVVAVAALALILPYAA